MPALRAALRPSLPLDRELRRREEPPAFHGVPERAARGAAVGSSHRLVRPGVSALTSEIAPGAPPKGLC